jgi:hypothetical protein
MDIIIPVPTVRRDRTAFACAQVSSLWDVAKPAMRDGLAPK